MRTLTDANVVACPEYAAPAMSADNRISECGERKDALVYTQYAKNLRPVGLLHTRMQMAAVVQQKHM